MNSSQDDTQKLWELVSLTFRVHWPFGCEAAATRRQNRVPDPMKLGARLVLHAFQGSKGGMWIGIHIVSGPIVPDSAPHWVPLF